MNESPKPFDLESRLAEGLGTFRGKRVDLTIKNTTEYIPWNTDSNGKLCPTQGACDNGRTLFQLNLQGDRRTNFEFCFTDAQDDPISPDVYFDFHDFDDTNNAPVNGMPLHEVEARCPDHDPRPGSALARSPSARARTLTLSHGH